MRTRYNPLTADWGMFIAKLGAQLQRTKQVVGAGGQDGCGPAVAALRMARNWVLAPSRATNSGMNAVGCRTRARPRRALTCSAQVEDRPLVGAGVRAKPCVRIHRGRAADHR